MESSNRTAQETGIFSDGGRAHKIHTKFSPDWHFGLWKMKWRHITAETLPEISSSVSRSSRNGHNLPQLLQDSESLTGLHTLMNSLRNYQASENTTISK